MKECIKKTGVLSEEGIALVMVLILSAIVLAVMGALVYMLTAGTQASAVHKRYKSALEAGKGGMEISYDIISARVNPLIPGLPITITAENVGGVDCLAQKLNFSTGVWDVACDKTVTIDPADPTSYDWTFNLGAVGTDLSRSYTVYAKIVDTVEGNSGGEAGLSKGGVVASNSGEITVMSRPYLYTLEIDAEKTGNPQERAKYSVLYQY